MKKHMNFADLIGYIAAAIGCVMFLPQAIKTSKTSDTR